MGRQWNPKQFCTLRTGERVPYSLAKRGKVYVLQFPDRAGLYLRKSTGKTSLAEALEATPNLVLKEWDPDTVKPSASAWDAVAEKLQATMNKNANRERTAKDYISTLSVLRATVDTKGPADVDDAKARQFRDEFLGSTYTRSNKKGATARPRSPATFNAYLRKLKSIWDKWLIADLRLVTRNPWDHVAKAQTDGSNPSVPDEAVFVAFLRWVRDRFPGWDLPNLFFQVKAFTGCRLEDLTEVRSDQLSNGYLSMDAGQTKARTHRRVKLPKDLYAALAKVKGPKLLWEAYPEGLAEFSGRADMVASKFEPSALYWWAVDQFREWNKGEDNPKLNSHDFRRRAITQAVKEGHGVDTVARMFSLSPQTARKYYLDVSKLDTDVEFMDMADKLVPKL